MKTKLKQCDGPCGEVTVIWKNHGGKRYCQRCWKLELPNNSLKYKPTVKQQPLPSRSPKRTREERLYSGKRIIFLAEHCICEAHLSGCTTFATEVHHKKGRTGDLLLDETEWLAACHNCHVWIELHPLEAKELGFSKSRLENDG